MNKRTANYLYWAIVVGFLIVPPILVRTLSSAAGGVRLLVYCCLIIVFTLFGGFLAFRRGDIVAEMPIGKELTTERSKRITALFFRGLAALMMIGGVYLAIEIAPGIAMYFLQGKAAITEMRTVRQITSPAMPGAFYIYMGILTDDKEQFSFEYPSPILQVGHTYAFTILPRTNFVLTATPIN